MTGPSWYEILGVRRDATPGEIKAAWRAATDKFEPGSGSSHFRLFNEAADVLLDPERRAAYDAELGADAAGPTDPSPTSVPTTVDLPPTHEHTPRKKFLRVPRPEHDTQRDPGPEPGRWTRLAVLVLLPLLTLASLAVAGLYGYKAHRDGQVEQARDEAPAAADRALEQVLAYDYRHLGADERRAAGYLTAHYKQKNHFARTYRLLRVGPNGQPGPAVSTKTVVTAHVLGTAVVDAAPDLARVLVFVNQTSTKTGKDPVIFQNRVVATMVHSGNAWLIDDLQSY